MGRTYKNYDGYAPIAAYLGMEVELRPGSQHAQAGFVAFIQRAIKSAKTLVDHKLLVRADAAHDSVETLAELETSEKVNYIIKWNPRRSDVQAWRNRVFAEGEATTPRTGKKVGVLMVKESKVVGEETFVFKRPLR